MRLCNTPDKVALDEFLPELQLLVSGVPSEIAAAYVRTAAIEFAERSLVLKRDVHVDLQCGVQEYLLEPPDEDTSRTIAIDFVCDDRGRRHVVRPNEPCNLICPCFCGPGCNESGYPLHDVGPYPLNASLPVWFKQPNSLFVLEPVRADFETPLRVTMSIAPDRDACDVDRLLYQRYLMPIVMGAASYLMLMPKQDWYAPQLAQKMEKDFKIAQARAAIDAMIGVSRGPFRAHAQRIV
jgi:hypothetical protein